MIPLILTALAFYPTIDGQRQTDEVAFADVPYVLGISCRPEEDLTFITVTQGNTTYYSDYCQGTFDIAQITGIEPVVMESDFQRYTIVPEPATILLITAGLIFGKDSK